MQRKINEHKIWSPRKLHGKNLERIWPTDPQGKTESTKKELKFLQKDYKLPARLPNATNQ